MSLLSVASQLLRAARYRREVQSLTELDDRTLADIGLLRTEVYASWRGPTSPIPSRS